MFPTEEIDVQVPDEVYGLTGEIQVRTTLEHVWADFSHKRVYKSQFSVPVRWQRELSGLAALLERADNAFADIEEALNAYAASYGAYMSEEEMRDEMAILQLVLRYSPDDIKLAHRIGKIAMTLGEWQKVVALFSPYVEEGYQPILRDLGISLCKLHRDDPSSPGYRRGQRYLESACAPPCRDSDALASLASTWEGIDETKARDLYRQAFEAEPDDPYPLGRYLEYEIHHTASTSLVSSLNTIIAAATQRCRDRAQVGINLPWSYYDIGKFLLLQGKPYESLVAYIKAVHLSVDDWMIETSLASLDKLAVVRDQLPGYAWVRRLLLLALAAKFPTADSLAQITELALPERAPIQAPVIIVAGACGDRHGKEMRVYGQLFAAAFQGFSGTVISGGSTSGICGLVGELQEHYPDQLTTLGYVPGQIPDDVTLDDRYRQLLQTEGADFSPLEPLQYWTDLIAGGIRPQQVRLIGISGGAIAAQEYRLALALGARVAVIEYSGRAASKLLADEEWQGTETLIHLPLDPMIVRAFIGGGIVAPEMELRETIAQALHESYCRTEVTRRQRTDPSLADWDNLLDNLRDSNRQQADHIFNMMSRINCVVRPVSGRPIELIQLTEAEIDLLARIEHSRWVVERLGAGWSWAPERDVTNKESPYLVPWETLTKDVQAWHRDMVRRIPALLAEIGLEIQRS